MIAAFSTSTTVATLALLNKPIYALLCPMLQSRHQFKTKVYKARRIWQEMEGYIARHHALIAPYQACREQLLRELEDHNRIFKGKKTIPDPGYTVEQVKKVFHDTFGPRCELLSMIHKVLVADLEHFDNPDLTHFQWYGSEPARNWTAFYVGCAWMYVSHLGDDNVGELLFTDLMPFKSHKRFWKVVDIHFPCLDKAKKTVAPINQLVMSVGWSSFFPRMRMILMDMIKYCEEFKVPGVENLQVFLEFLTHKSQMMEQARGGDSRLMFD